MDLVLKMRNLIVFLLVTFSFCVRISAQDALLSAIDSDFQSAIVEPGGEIGQSDSLDCQNRWDHLTIISDSRIDDLLAIHKEECIRKKGIDGYRVQIFQGSMDEAYRVKAKFLSTYPDFPEKSVHVKFLTPDFRVRLGDFRNRSEAINLKYKIITDFPNPFIVEDIIDFPEIGH
ncbi:MAG TPA: SPOR domain-containing protein [Prolixibacteraceae bacterium]|nr:SPOR domain-containing protein [Prolixibacteraceae bacterium]